MKGLIDSMKRFYNKMNHGFYYGWDVGYCKNCEEIVFVTGTQYEHYRGRDCDGNHYEIVDAGAPRCRGSRNSGGCGSTKYILLEDFLMGEQFPLLEALETFDKALEKFRTDKFIFTTLFSLYDEKDVFKQEIDKWLSLAREEKCSVLREQRELRKKIKESENLKSGYSFS